jgi:putative ABC transport system substrate-binding protein
LLRRRWSPNGLNVDYCAAAKRKLRLLHDLVPQATRIAVLVNSSNPATMNATIDQVQQAGSALGLQIEILKAGTTGAIDEVFAGFARERPDALFVAPNAFFTSRRVQLAALTARDKIPAAYSQRDLVEAGGLMSYGTDLADMFRQVGLYAGLILKGANPADLPVTQSTKFEFVLNLGTAKALGLDVPPTLLALTDEVIE